MLNMDVVDLDALFAAVLHPEQLALSGVEVGPYKTVAPKLAVDADHDGVAFKDQLHGSPSVGAEVVLFSGKVLVGAECSADGICRTRFLEKWMIRIFRVGIDLKLHSVSQ